MNRFTFFDDKELLANSEPLIKSQPITANAPGIAGQMPEQYLRYRCEQTVAVSKKVL